MKIFTKKTINRVGFKIEKEIVQLVDKETDQIENGRKILAIQ